eukprot:scaffold18312_cov77-Cyclotella_meneghiniana.AAC.5
MVVNHRLDPSAVSTVGSILTVCQGAPIFEEFHGLGEIAGGCVCCMQGSCCEHEKLFGCCKSTIVPFLIDDNRRQYHTSGV